MPEATKMFSTKGHEYEGIRKLGEGYTGEVYLAKDKERNEPVALKLLNPEAFKEGQLEAFKREFSLLSDLHHPHLCKVYDFGFFDAEQRYFFTSELIQGTDLYKYTDKLSMEEIEEIFVQITDAIGYIHSKGLIHFDIKGANILMTLLNNKPLAKVVDFGLAAPSVDVPDNIVGTVRYISPEMITKNQTIDYRADLYSLGIVLYRMLAKEYPKQGNTMDEVLAWHTKHAAVEKDAMEVAGAPEYMMEVVEKLTNPVPTERFSSASVIIKYIELHSGKSYKKTQRELLTTLTEEGPLIARDSVMQSIRATITKMGKKEPVEDVNPTLIISGPHGIGKTRMLKETKYISQLNELETITISGREQGSDMQSLKKAFGILDEGPSFDLVAAVTKVQPLCLMVDDLDKCNQQIREMFVGLANYLYSLKFMGGVLGTFLIITMTKTSAKASLPIPMHLGVDEENLLPFTEEQITQYIRQFLGESNPPVQQIRDIFAFSGGVPELVRTAIASLESSTARLTRDTNRLFVDIIGKLSPLAKNLLGLFAIGDMPFRQEELVALTGTTIEGGLTDLTKAGVVRYDRKDETYRIATGATASASKDAFSENESAEIAKKLLAYVLEHDPENTDLQVKFASTGAPPGEFGNYLVKAAEKKEKRGEVDQSYNFYEQALSKIPADDARRPDICRKLTRFSILTGKITKAADYINDASKLTSKTADDLVSMSWIDRLRHNPKDALQHIQEALNMQDVKQDEVRYLKLLNEKAQCYLQMGETKEAENIFRDTLDRSQKISEEDKKKVANNNLGVALARDGKFGEAIEFYKRKYEFFAGDKRLSSSILTQLGFVYQQCNMIDEGLDAYKKALELAEEIGDTHNASTILGNIICLCQSKSLYTDALNYAQESIKYASRAASEKALGSNFLTIGALYVNLGLEDVARKYLTEAVSIFQKLGDKIMETWVQLSFAYLYKNAGKYKEALAYFENIIVQGKTANNKELMNWGLYGAVELYLDAMNFEKANKYVQQIDAAWPGREKAKETDIKYELLRCKLAVYGEGEAGEPVRERLSELAELTTKFGLRELASEAYHVLGTLDEKTGNERVAAKDLATAKEILDDIVGSLSEEYRDSFLKQKYRAALSEESTRLNRSLNIEPQRIKRPEPPPSQQPSPAAPEAAPPRRQEATTVIPQQQAKAPPEKTAQLGAGQDAVQTSSFGGVKTSDYVVVKEDIVGQSDAVARVKDIIEHVKDSHMSVLIYGESGVGKDLVAKSIRKKGSYKNSPFLSIDIEEFPDEFLSDEIFGLEKEAMLEAAGNGIILLKHIEAMPKSVQKELEKAAKNRKFKRLRDKKEVSIACRFIATSRLGINELIKEKKFDKDLLKLLSQIPIHIPPLRDRVEDLPILINYILSVVDPARPHTIDNDALKAIVEHEWRGNIKELEHTLKAAMILATDGHITLPQIEIHLKRSA